ELFADTVVRLVESGRIPQRDLQVELLDDAFHAAAGAKEPVRLIAVPSTPPDTRALYRARAGDLMLDALSLQSRILKQLVTVDRAKARELFDQMVHPAEAALTCEDPLLPDLSPYYEIAATIAQSTFTPAEKAQEVHIQFLVTVLSQAKSPAELAAFARSLESVELKPEQFELLLGAFSKTMESMDADFRSFESSIDALQKEIDGLNSRANSSHIGTEALIKTYRKFLVTGLTAARCNDSFGGAPDAVAWIGAHASPLTADETKPSKKDGVVKADPYFQSADSQQLGAELRQLSSANRSAPEFPGQFADFVRDYSAWQPPGDEMDAFHERATVLRALLGVAAPGEDRDRIVEMCSALVASSGAEHQSPAEWLWQTKMLLEAAGADAAKMLASFRASGDPALAIYAGPGN
ncbi:MAG TPA: hypothetical protein VK419_11240, partial [Bryobacteraceae bacterium]|nr:hypothetical protein [Bryobacteraceae bacterium]